MPELPDLLHIRTYLKKEVCGRRIAAATVKQPVVLRVAMDGTPESLLKDRRIDDIHIHGPFLRFECSGDCDLIVNLMLMGTLQHQRPGEKPAGYLCFSCTLDDTSSLNLCDEQKMAKAYLVRRWEYGIIPRYENQGVDIRGTGFTLDLFRRLVREHARKQVRVFINDHTILSAIGNAYADEILFHAQIHPKTFLYKLNDDEVGQLYNSIGLVIAWGIEQVAKAAQPIHVKVRGHMKVRWRKGEPCLRCGTTIRREGVRGHDVFFCPSCQQQTRKLFIDWRTP